MPHRSATDRPTRRVTRSQTRKAEEVDKNEDNITTTANITNASPPHPNRTPTKKRATATLKKKRRAADATESNGLKRQKRPYRKSINTTTTKTSNETPESAESVGLGSPLTDQTVNQNNMMPSNLSTFAERTILQQLTESLVDQSATATDAAQPTVTHSPDSKPIFDILDALMDMPNMEFLPTDTFLQDHAAAKEALRLNLEMQRLVEKQIEKIDTQIAKNDEFAKETRLLSIREARIQRKRMDIHKYYTENYEFFVDDEGNMPISLEERKNALESETERVRNWTAKEREQLSAAIHSEVQRILAFEHVARNEPWRVWEVDNLSRHEWENYPVDKLDWNRISSLYVKTKGPMNCMIQWTTQDHPAINKQPWKNKESKELGELVKKHGYEGNWERIASELNTDRTAGQCFQHYQAKFKGYDQKRPWTEQDDQDLQDAVALIGERNWQQVAVLIGDRSGQQCLHRWVKSINPAIRRSRWTAEEDAALKASVAVYGVGAWSYIQRHIPGRTDMQCRERWTNVLDPNLKHGKFTDDEKQRLKALVEEHGRKWSVIAEHMTGRTDNICLRTWNKMVKQSNQKSSTPAKAARRKAPKSTNQQDPHTSSTISVSEDQQEQMTLASQDVDGGKS